MHLYGEQKKEKKKEYFQTVKMIKFGPVVSEILHLKF